MNRFKSVYLCISAFFLIVCSAFAQGGRKNKMFDISQYARPEWGNNWCAPTAVGNSFAWLAKEYGLDGLMKVNGTGDPMSAISVINVLGNVDMNTDPNSGTTGANVDKGKKSYIERHGLKDKITVEKMIRPTKQWLKEQYEKGQDVELGVGYYILQGGNWVRKGGHIDTYGVIPGEDAGGHVISLVGLLDPSSSLPDSDFQISFTDPGRDDLVGNYGCIADDQYLMEDYVGDIYSCTASTYNILWEPDLFDPGVGGYLLEGYQGEGDFGRSNAPTRTIKTVWEVAWAESVPEPGTFMMLAMAGLMGLFYGYWWKK